MNDSTSRLLRLIIVLTDMVTVILSYFVAIDVRNFFLSDQFAIMDYFRYPRAMFFLFVIWGTMLIGHDAYAKNRFESLRKEITDVFLIGVVAFVFIGTIGFMTKYYFARSLLISYSVVVIFFLIIQKATLYFIIRYQKSRTVIPVLIVGAGAQARELADKISNGNGNSFKIIGFLDNDASNIGMKIGAAKITGTYDQLQNILETHVIQQVIFVLPGKDLSCLDALLAICDKTGVTSQVIYKPVRQLLYKVRVDSVAGFPSIKYYLIPQNELALFLKRLLDIVVSALLLVLLLPFFILIAIMIKWSSKGSVFYPWLVVGQNNRDFASYKFRTMIENADDLKDELMHQNEMNGPVFKIKDDPRITTIGVWLRKYSLDELPQLWSVLKGDMSLVGPRPPFRSEIDRCELWQRRKISFKPGMTCLWQVSGRNQISDFNEWCRLDLEYIDNWSLWLDFKILMKTAWVVLKGTGC
jgi:exopolysaccharide biosynthesis polyprenyl glycosylphosphotransferase